MAIAVLLGGCGKKETPAAAVPVPAVSNASLPAPSVPPQGIPGMAMQCDDFVTIAAGEYMIENNTWGKGSMSGWRQCVGLMTNARRGASALWSWDWKYEGDQVKAYPEVIYGHKPGYPKSTTAQLPRKLKQLSNVRLDYEVNSQRQGSGNLSVDIWFTSTPTPTTFSVPTITHEVMIWLDVQGAMFAGGQQVDETTINGVPYKVFVGDNFGMGWRYIAFTPVQKTTPTAGSLELWAFFNYLRDKKWLGGEDHLSAVNFGNEIITGTGETRLHHYAVTVQ
jgi:hypothetical protein